MEERFRLGQKVVHREDWKKKMRLMGMKAFDGVYTVTDIFGREESSVVKLDGAIGNWTCEAITAYKEPVFFDDELFVL